MSEDKNTEMMNRFIEAATPKLLEALTDQVAELVESKIGGLVENSTKLLDEVKKAKAQPDTKLAELEKMIGELRSGQQTAADESKDKMFSTPAAIQLTREQARDPKLYRAAKEKATADGTTVEILAE